MVDALMNGDERNAIDRDDWSGNTNDRNTDVETLSI